MLNFRNTIVQRIKERDDVAGKKGGASKIAKMNQNVRLMIVSVKDDYKSLVILKDKLIKPSVRVPDNFFFPNPKRVHLLFKLNRDFHERKKWMMN